MDFWSTSPQVAQLRERLLAFMAQHIYPNERRYYSDGPSSRTPVAFRVVKSRSFL
jgi:hypothetical protein